MKLDTFVLCVPFFALVGCGGSEASGDTSSGDGTCSQVTVTVDDDDENVTCVDYPTECKTYEDCAIGEAPTACSEALDAQCPAGSESEGLACGYREADETKALLTAQVRCRTAR